MNIVKAMTFPEDSALSPSPGDQNLGLVTSFTVPPTDISLSANTVLENQPGGMWVGNFTTNDLDTPETHTYSLVSDGSDDNAAFTIPANSNELRTAASFNYEAKSSYSIRVRSTGNTDGFSFEKSFIITVTNINETPSDISLTSASVAENQLTNTVVGAFSTTDPDTGQSHSYSLVSGNGSTDNNQFNLSDNSLRTSFKFDYQAKNSYSIRVRTTDNGSPALEHEKVFNIAVTDVLPVISVAKTANPTSVPETGATVNFTVKVNNTGQENITLQNFSDNKFNLGAFCPNAVGTMIPSGNNYICTFTAFISGNFSGPAHQSAATATARDNENHTDTDSDSATVSFTDVKPALSVTYTPGSASVVEPGGNVNFSVLVTNLGTETGTLTLLQDSASGNLNGRGNCALNGVIVPHGGTYSCSFTQFVSGSAGANNIYTATARLADDDENTKNASGNAVVTLREQPKIYLPLVSKPGPTELFIENDTNGVVTFTVVGTGVSCNVPARHQSFFCGSFPPGDYTIQVHSICGDLTTTKTYGSGRQSTRVFCR